MGLGLLLAPLAGGASRFALGAQEGAPGGSSLTLKAPDRFRTAPLVAASVGLTAAYGKAPWWQDGFTGQFKTVNEGWFGQGTAHGGADKLGHAMVSYTGTRLVAPTRHAYYCVSLDSAELMRAMVCTMCAGASRYMGS